MVVLYPSNHVFRTNGYEIVRRPSLDRQVFVFIGNQIRISGRAYVAARKVAMAIRTNARNYNRLCLGAIVHRRSLVVAQAATFVLVKRTKAVTHVKATNIANRRQFFSGCQRGISIPMVTFSHATRVNVTRASGKAIAMVVAKANIPSTRANVKARLRRAVEGKHAQRDITVSAHSSGGVRVIYMDEELLGSKTAKGRSCSHDRRRRPFGFSSRG